MSLRLDPRAALPHRFAEHPVSRLRMEPPRRAVLGAGAGLGAHRRPVLSDAAFVEDPRGEALFLDKLGFAEPGPGHGPDDGPDQALDLAPEGSADRSADQSSDPAPDHAAARAQAEAEDVALVRLAAARLAVALRDVAMLLRGDRGSRRSDALERCTAKGWITLQGDPWSVSQTFRVTPEGYRAAGLRVPPFVS